METPEHAVALCSAADRALGVPGRATPPGGLSTEGDTDPNYSRPLL